MKKSNKLAEMIGIILGDGHLSKNGRTITITLNQIKEFNYINYVKSMMIEIFNKKISIQDLPNNQAVQIRLNNSAIVKDLVSIGLSLGNKVKNQVGVPSWIKKSQSLSISCLRGLIDTDGSIFPVIREEAKKINFKNNSKPLVEDFKEMCESLNIRTSKIIQGLTNSRGNQFKYFKVHIGARNQVEKFLNVIKPKKWELNLKRFKEIFEEKGLKIENAFKYKRLKTNYH